MSIQLMENMVFTSIFVDEEMKVLTFRNDDITFIFYHSQDCCEDVYIESIVGYLDDLIGSPILLAESSSNTGENSESEWTFYKFATRKGYVDVRWVGFSNGYYSMSVNLKIINHSIN